ncbi:MAG: tRNA (adenosine(37)-N6)-dimethylallyltransferase MiaA [Firmicutes bacterium]|nr:tRNA (adenosine(37)-N6)-dimethylallyltransferase MiaA [Bacillota bacterium]
MGSPKIPLLALVGPTAAGKSALALEVARRLGNEIISADSAQVYRGLDIGTAKPSAAEQRLIRHHLIDLVDPDEDYSVADYQRDARPLIARQWHQGRLPFIVGGTGLYLQAVTADYAFGSRGKDEALRRRLNAEAAAAGPEVLHRRLQRLDPAAAAKIHPNDRRRIIRALEVYTLEGRPISQQVERTEKRESPYQLLTFGLTRPRPLLYRAIEERTEEMLARGMLDEVRGLLERGYPRHSPGLQILGYRQLAAYLDGETTLAEAAAAIKQETRRLAKRQLTWFRRDREIIWLERPAEGSLAGPAEIIVGAVKEIFGYTENKIG